MIETILYMDITANGLIAKPDGNSDWVSQADWESFDRLAKAVGVVIMGRKTYEVLMPDNFPLDIKLNVVLTHQDLSNKWAEQVLFTSQSPKQLLELLQSRNFQKVLVVGGAETVTQFLKEKLADEIYLDVEPLLFGKGLPLIAPHEAEYQLELLEVNKLTEQTIQLHYKIQK